MPLEFIKYAFVAGELSPTLLQRTDLQKYDLGLAQGVNFFVNYQGGITSRPGMQFVDYIMSDTKATKFVPFSFAPNVSNTYMLLFGDYYVRFLQNGAYVVEDDVTITGVTQGSPCVVTAAGHGYSNGDWISISGISGMTELNGRTYIVANKTTNTFNLLDPLSNTIDTTDYTAYTSGGVCNRVYTVTTPYPAEDLSELQAYQIRDYIRLTHPGYKIRNLIRNDHTDWDLEIENIGTSAPSVSNLSGLASATGDVSVVFGVTPVMDDGSEGRIANVVVIENCVNYTATAGFTKIAWDAVTDAAYYNVYRSRIITGATDANKSEELGFCGRTNGPQFVDPNIIPDFTTTAPEGYNPFADGAIRHINMVTQGSAYDESVATITVTDPTGGAFVGYPICNNSGAIIGVTIVDGGLGYSSPSASFSGGGGSGATATFTLSEAGNNDPRCATIFQQRQIYAGSNNQPITVFGSQTGKLSNFDVSRIVLDSDYFEHTLTATELSPIKYLLPTRKGLLIFSTTGIWLMSGGDQTAVTPTNVAIDLQTTIGCADIPPLLIDSDILLIEGKSETVRLFEYNEISQGYIGQDMSILSNHFFQLNNPIISWAHARNPYKLVWAAREDGLLLSMTLVKEQEVFAWMQHKTRGFVRDVETIQENSLDTVYLVTERWINGRWTKFIETFANRDFENVEDAFCVDCGLQRTLTYPDGTATLAAAEGETIAFVASLNIFSSASIGDVIIGNGGRGVIDSYIAPNIVTLNITRPFNTVAESDGMPLPFNSGDWAYASYVSSVSGLHHLEGETVKIVGDGNVLEDAVVTDGTVTLSSPAVKVSVGLGYNCYAQTLPLTTSQGVIEGRRKDVLAVVVRYYETTGLSIGDSLNDMYELRNEVPSYTGVPPQMTSGMQEVSINAGWEIDSQFWFAQTYPLPATLLGFITNVDVGDDQK